MSKPHNPSFDYIGAHLNRNYVFATNKASEAFGEQFTQFYKTYKNNIFDYSKGNVFEYIQGAKFKIAGARAGKDIKFNSVNDARGLHTSPDDFVTYTRSGQPIHYQFKFYDDPHDMIKAMADSHHKHPWNNMKFVGPIDNYKPAMQILRNKYRNGTITKDELFVYKNLKPGVPGPDGSLVATNKAEVYSVRGKNGKVGAAELIRYKQIQANQAFRNECINNVKSVTLVSTLTGCIISTVSNVYKYTKDEQTIEDAAKNIGIDTAKAAGHGVLSASIANGFKYIGFKTGSEFLHESVNALVISNGVIDIGKAFYYYNNGLITMDDLTANVIGSSALTAINLGLNLVLTAHPFIKLATTIVVNQICHSLFGLNVTPKEKATFDRSVIDAFLRDLSIAMKQMNYDLQIYLNNNLDLLKQVRDYLVNNEEYTDEGLKNVFELMNMGDEYMSLQEFSDKLLKGEPIVMKIKGKKKL